MDLAPRHRVPVPLPRPWPSGLQGLLRAGAPWLHTGHARTGDAGGDLVGLELGRRLEARWDGRAWACTLDGTPAPGSPYEALDAAVRASGRPWAGAVSFELACDEAGHARKGLPPGTLGLAWRELRTALAVGDGRAELWGWGPEPPDPARWAAAWSPSCALGKVRGTLRPDWDAARHGTALRDLQDRIRNGGFYVANLCVPFRGSWEGDGATLALAALRRARPPYGAFLDLGDLQLLSLSMERLLARRGDRIWTEPIKGSAPLPREPSEAAARAEALRADPKERAEHTMIVDLLRNDLGRVARAGSVEVEALMAVEAFPTVQHLVSRVGAELRPRTGLPELLRAVLPGGSVTGAPKHAVCDFLARTEAAPRGFYCGAHGWIAPDGDLDLALPIRTLQLAGHEATYWTGGGITRRSEAGREWEELALKARVLEGLFDLEPPAPHGGVEPVVGA